MKFETLVKPEIARALKEEQIETLTHIQEKTIPLIQEGKDVVGISKTGSGKTIAFAAPILEKMEKGKGIQAIVLCPTRELAVQISLEFEKFGKYTNLKVVTVFGGVAMSPQISAIKKSEIFVGTPGRTLDHLVHNTLDLSQVKTFVIDEADKMVAMGFIEDITEIIDQTPRNKQILLFGATIQGEIGHLKDKYMHDAIIVRSELRVTNDVLKQFYYNVEHKEKFSLLVHLLRKEGRGKTLVFCSARTTVDLVANNLKKQGFSVECIHGKMSQVARLKVMEDFNKGHPQIMVASPVAARGLHIEDVTHVYNYDLSQDSEEYIHRIGRTARAGETGVAITLVSPRDYDAFDAILTRHGMQVENLPRENFEKVPFDIRQRYNKNALGPGGGQFGRSRSFGNRQGAGRSGGRGQFNRGGPSRSGPSRSSPNRGPRTSFGNREERPRSFGRPRSQGDSPREQRSGRPGEDRPQHRRENNGKPKRSFGRDR